MVANLHIGDLPASVVLKGSIAIDTETSGLKITRDRLCLAQICDEAGTVHFIKFPRGNGYNAPNLRAILLDEARLKIFHYARFDVATLCYYLQLPQIRPIFCTKIASKLVRTYTDYHGLKALTREFLSVELEKESQSSNWSAEKLTDKQLRYAANDVLHLHKLKTILSGMLEDSGRTAIAERLFDFVQTAAELETTGFDVASVISHS